MTASDDGRNRLLRRADWRFLGGAPAPHLSVVYGDGLLDDAVRAVSRRTVDGRFTTVRGRADLAVAVDPDAATLRAAWLSLRPDGTCYTEWTSRSACVAAGVRRRLAAAQFSDVALYTPRPASEDRSPIVWMPLGSGSAARWYLARAHQEGEATSMFGRAAWRVGWRAAEALPVVLPVCAIARKGVGERGDFQRLWRRALCNDHGDLLGPVLLTPGRHTMNKVVMLALDGHGAPARAMKVPRIPAAAGAIRREAAVLEQVGALHGDLPGIPRMLLSGDCAGIPFVVESAVNGVLALRYARIDFDGTAERAVAWQARLINEGEPLAPSGRHRLIDRMLEYLDTHISKVAGRELIAVTRNALVSLPELPGACEHRDFSPWNVFVTSSGELAVADWESAEPRGLPALDLIYFLTYLVVAREQAWAHDRLVDVHRAILAPGTAGGVLTRHWLSSYAERVGLDPAVIESLRVLCWLQHSRSKYLRTLHEDGIPPDPSELRRSIFLILWEQEVAAMLTRAA